MCLDLCSLRFRLVQLVLQPTMDLEPRLSRQELCGNGGGRPGLPSLKVLEVSVDGKQHLKKRKRKKKRRKKKKTIGT